MSVLSLRFKGLDRLAQTEKEQSIVILNRLIGALHKVGIMLMGAPLREEPTVVWRESDREWQREAKTLLLSMTGKKRGGLKPIYNQNNLIFSKEELVCLSVYCGIKFMHYVTLNLPETLSLLDKNKVTLTLIVHRGTLLQGYLGNENRLNNCYFGRAISELEAIEVYL